MNKDYLILLYARITGEEPLVWRTEPQQSPSRQACTASPSALCGSIDEAEQHPSQGKSTAEYWKRNYYD
jgi:hypothetical protein